MEKDTAMQVAHFALGPLSTNCFLVYTKNEAIAVDPGGEPGAVLRFLKDKALRLTHILLTHLHFDHTYGVHALVTATGARTLASGNDAHMMENEFGLGGIWGLPEVEPFTFEFLEAGELPLLGGLCRVLPTPGHTPGGLSFYFEQLQAVFSGDALFYRSVGRTDFPGGSSDTLLHSIRTQLFTLPEETIVYSGHGPETRIGDERRNNPYAGDFRD
ncbi:MBL fold metallo-hydrolase [Desulfovibrio sp. OttesenSCG-928-A18]|nr:MBL fold metallo-hydrolase [Desulfovibrio sp. OttesenSCG-928-A18]